MSTVQTHCLPNQTLGTNEIPVCNVSQANTAVTVPTGGLGNGNIRGIVVSMHGLSVAIEDIPTSTGSYSVVNGNSTIAGYAVAGTDMVDNLVNDGWMVLAVPYPEDYYVGIGSTGIWLDMNSDSTYGARYLAGQMHWWDHVVEFIHNTYGEDLPIVASGASWGGWHALQVAINRQSSIVAYCAQFPATLVSYVNPQYTEPSCNFGPYSAGTVVNGITLTAPLINGTSGSDIPANALNANVTTPIGITNPNGVTIPGLILYGTNDTAVGWEATASTPGSLPINSNTDQILTNAYNAGLPTVRNQTANTHELTNDNVGSSAVFSQTGPTALSSLSTLPVQNPAGGGLNMLVSGACGIFGSDNQWHTITFTNFTFFNYVTTAVSDVTSLPSSLTLGSTSGLSQTSGAITVVTTGTTLYATFSGVSGNTLNNVTYVSGTGSIVNSPSSILQLIPYVTTAITSTQIIDNTIPSTISLNSTAGFNPSGGQVHILTSSVYFPLVISYATVSGNNLTGVAYVSGADDGIAGSISGNATNAAFPMDSIIGCSYSGSNLSSVTVEVGSPVALSGVPIPGGYMNMSMAYWLAQSVDPIFPRQF